MFDRTISINQTQPTIQWTIFLQEASYIFKGDIVYTCDRDHNEPYFSVLNF